jgi:hypothetical protein
MTDALRAELAHRRRHPLTRYLPEAETPHWPTLGHYLERIVFELEAEGWRSRSDGT